MLSDLEPPRRRAPQPRGAKRLGAMRMRAAHASPPRRYRQPPRGAKRLGAIP